jgi:hypothetical protein
MSDFSSPCAVTKRAGREARRYKRRCATSACNAQLLGIILWRLVIGTEAGASRLWILVLRSKSATMKMSYLSHGANLRT